MTATRADVRRPVRRPPLPSGPYDEDERYPDGVHRTDFGALRLPVPAGGVVTVEPSAKGKLQAVHVTVPEGRLLLSALAAPTTTRLWPELAREIDTSLRAGGARVRSFQGPWGRELRARTGEAMSVFVGIDGPRWMVYGVATGPAKNARALDRELRRVLGGTVVVRGSLAYPVRTVLPLVLPDELAAEQDARDAEATAAVAAVEGAAEQAAAAPGGPTGRVPVDDAPTVPLRLPRDAGPARPGPGADGPAGPGAAPAVPADRRRSAAARADQPPAAHPGVVADRAPVRGRPPIGGSAGRGSAGHPLAAARPPGRVPPSAAGGNPPPGLAVPRTPADEPRDGRRAHHAGDPQQETPTAVIPAVRVPAAAAAGPASVVRPPAEAVTQPALAFLGTDPMDLFTARPAGRHRRGD